MPTSRGRRILPALSAVVFAVLIAIGCSSSDSTTPTSVQSSSGTSTLEGTWVRCSPDGSTYEKDVYVFSGSSVTVTMWTSLVQSDCSDATGAASGSVSASMSITGTKSVSFTTDGTTAVTTPPSGLTQPVDATTVQYTVTASSDPVYNPVGEVFTALIFIHDGVTPNELYEDDGSTGTDGYPNFLAAYDPLVRQ